jgi:hypothetical protein
MGSVAFFPLACNTSNINLSQGMAQAAHSVQTAARCSLQGLPDSFIDRELRPELDLEEIWSFGVPCAGMTLPGLRLEPDSKESGAPLTGLPSDVKLRIW